MSVNMSSLWELITEVTDHTTELVDLVILGVVILCAYAIAHFIMNIFDNMKGGNKKDPDSRLW